MTRVSTAGFGRDGPRVQAIHEAAETEIAATLAVYFDGLHYSDTSRLRSAFHPLATYACATDGTLVHLTMQQYLPIVDARPSPASRGEERTDRIVSIDLVGPVTAIARVECSIGPKRFTDLLSMVCVDNRWQIISKVFHYELASEVSHVNIKITGEGTTVARKAELIVGGVRVDGCHGNA